MTGTPVQREPSSPRRAARNAILGRHAEHAPLVILLEAFLGVLLVMFPVGIVLMLTGSLTNDKLWMTSAFLGVQFALTLIFALTVCRVTPALLATVLLVVLSILVEFIGVTTGYPFGRYYYSYFLEPFIIGNVPLAISFAWYSLVVNGYFLVLFLGGSRRANFMTIVMTVLLVVGLDMALEPFAAYVNRYWRWMDGAIPVQNFLSWAGLALVFALVLSRFMVAKEPFRSRRLAVLPALVLGLNLLQFLIVNMIHGYWMLSLGSIVVVSGVVFVAARRGSHAV